MTKKEAKAKDYDLEERTALFGERVIKFVKKIPSSPINHPLISQLVRSATCIGANYCEANDGVSKKDFKNKIGFCRKESKETKHWLRMIATANGELKEQARTLWQEAKELNLIFSQIFRSCQ
jgi:four helix bundle protein